MAVTYRLTIDTGTGAILTAAQAATAPAGTTERVTRTWSRQLERDITTALGTTAWRPDPITRPAPPALPEATGKPSRDLGTLHRHLRRLAATAPDATARDQAAALAEDIDTVLAAWIQDALPGPP